MPRLALHFYVSTEKRHDVFYNRKTYAAAATF